MATAALLQPETDEPIQGPKEGSLTFEQELLKKALPEWRLYFVNYGALKRLAHEAGDDPGDRRKTEAVLRGVQSERERLLQFFFEKVKWATVYVAHLRDRVRQLGVHVTDSGDVAPAGGTGARGSEAARLISELPASMGPALSRSISGPSGTPQCSYGTPSRGVHGAIDGTTWESKAAAQPRIPAVPNGCETPVRRSSADGPLDTATAGTAPCSAPRPTKWRSPLSIGQADAVHVKGNGVASGDKLDSSAANGRRGTGLSRSRSLPGKMHELHRDEPDDDIAGDGDSNANAMRAVFDDRGTAADVYRNRVVVTKKALKDFKREMELLDDYYRMNDASLRRICHKLDSYLMRSDDDGEEGFRAQYTRASRADRPVGAAVETVAQLREHMTLLLAAVDEQVAVPRAPDWHRTKVYTVGCFDVFHRGHENLLASLREFGRYVIAGIHDDASYKKLKKKAPENTLMERIARLRPHVDSVFVIPHTDPTVFLEAIVSPQDIEAGVTCFVRGEDMPAFPGRRWVEGVMPVHLLPRYEGVSSTMVKRTYGGDPRLLPHLGKHLVSVDFYDSGGEAAASRPLFNLWSESEGRDTADGGNSGSGDTGDASDSEGMADLPREEVLALEWEAAHDRDRPLTSRRRQRPVASAGTRRNTGVVGSPPTRQRRVDTRRQEARRVAKSTGRRRHGSSRVAGGADAPVEDTPRSKSMSPKLRHPRPSPSGSPEPEPLALAAGDTDWRARSVAADHHPVAGVVARRSQLRQPSAAVSPVAAAAKSRGTNGSTKSGSLWSPKSPPERAAADGGARSSPPGGAGADGSVNYDGDGESRRSTRWPRGKAGRAPGRWASARRRSRDVGRSARALPDVPEQSD